MMVRPVICLLMLATIGHQVNGWGLDWFDWLNDKDTVARVKANGYPCEKHIVTTQDGYILKMFRIPHGKTSSDSTKSRPPVILQHGVLCSSDCWVVGSTSRALAYVLADNGYDVWLTNSRGNTYSRDHVTLSIDDAKFWNYSIHEMGIYDLPAEIDYVLQATKREKLSYIGHSQGTTIFFIMASSLPEYASKLNIANTLAPVVYLDNTLGAVKSLSSVSKTLVKLAKLFGLNHVMEKSILYAAVDHMLCSLPFAGNLCADFIFFVSGFDSPALDYNVLTEVADFCPTGVSIKDLDHYAQWTRNGGKFAKYDYGDGNMAKYNSTTPPEYQLSNIVAPVALFYSCNDFIATCPEVKRLASNIPTLVESYEIPYKEFNHIDFMWATNIREVLTAELLAVLKKYN